VNALSSSKSSPGLVTPPAFTLHQAVHPSLDPLRSPPVPPGSGEGVPFPLSNDDGPSEGRFGGGFDGGSSGIGYKRGSGNGGNGGVGGGPMNSGSGNGGFGGGPTNGGFGGGRKGVSPVGVWFFRLRTHP
jgi:hypothetical protein